MVPNNVRVPILRVEAKPDELQVCTWIHLTTALAPFTGVLHLVAAIVLWQVKREGSAYTDDHGREVVNFQISLMIYSVVLGILGFLVIPLIALAAVWIVAIVSLIRGAVAASRGEIFRYPMCLRFIR